MNIEATLAIYAILIPTALGILLSNFFKKYDEKIVKINTFILGLLVKARNELVANEIAKTNSEGLKIDEDMKDYNDLIIFMKNSKFLKYANEYEEMLRYQSEGDKKITYLSFELLGLCIPIFLLQMEGLFYSIGYIFLIFNFVLLLPNAIEILRMINCINGLYNQYVIGQQSFGCYDS